MATFAPSNADVENFPLEHLVQSVNLIVMNEERDTLRGILLNSAKQYIRLEFMDGDRQTFWNIPTSSITSVMMSVLPCKMMWVALRIPPLPGKLLDENSFQVVFSISQFENGGRNVHFLKQFFHRTCSPAAISEVNPVEFNRKFTDEITDFLLYDLFDEDFDEKPKFLNDCSSVDEGSEQNTTGDEVIIRYRDRTVKTIQHSFLVGSLEPNGWFSNSFIDIVMEYMKQEKLSKWDTWKNDVIFYDTFFYQRLARFEKDLEAMTDKKNQERPLYAYPRLMETMYKGKRGLLRDVPEFKKELIVIPVIDKKHWFLVLVHRPMDALRDDWSEYLVDDLDKKRRCRIIILDSFSPDRSMKAQLLAQVHEKAFQCIKNWLCLMYFHTEEFPNTYRGCLKIVPPNVPKQQNHDDCGAFLLKFIEEFVLEDWSWTDLAHSELHKMNVRNPEEFQEQVLAYRDNMAEVIRSLAVNLPSD